MNPFNRPGRRRPSDRPSEPVKPSTEDLIEEMNRDLRDNPAKRRKIKPEDLTLGDVRAAAQEVEKLREMFRDEIEDQIRKRLRDLLRRNPDLSLQDYLDDDSRDGGQDDEDEDESDAA